MSEKIPPEVDPEDNTNKFCEYFKFISVLGSGAFGVVVAAEDRKHENIVCAVKVIYCHYSVRNIHYNMNF